MTHNVRIKNRLIIALLDDPRHSKFVDPFNSYDYPTKSGSLFNSRHNSNKSLELRHTHRYNSQVYSSQNTQKIQKIVHGRVQHENEAETLKLSGKVLDEEEEDDDLQAARPDNPQSVSYEELLMHIVDSGKGNNSNSGQNVEGININNADFEVPFNADHG